eukprot:CAMPEP_0168428742 /NCGR_PEP_ID=MMETSP0228-20121227/37015_1 /TAXON_ID=133427 /ORGANISM="Protoceratium reticulatum, Strain CCCM 535 (=CCMP 1889)" /LENGTH=71 /DNA_ID=CAMNT_0008442813 /DNA_START=1 /DNA_END=216 /DNA_ORIENTATION=-
MPSGDDEGHSDPVRRCRLPDPDQRWQRADIVRPVQDAPYENPQKTTVNRYQRFGSSHFQTSGHAQPSCLDM